MGTLEDGMRLGDRLDARLPRRERRLTLHRRVGTDTLFGQRLVEQHDRGVVEHAARDVEPASHPA